MNKDTQASKKRGKYFGAYLVSKTEQEKGRDFLNHIYQMEKYDQIEQR
jgi:hypothetical protein